VKYTISFKLVVLFDPGFEVFYEGLFLLVEIT